MITYLITQGIQAAFNLINSRLDAYRILKHKGVAHWLNFLTYGAVVGLLCWHYCMGWESILVAIAGFFNRQLSFDIPLNLRRKLPWHYQSTAQPPKAVMDRIERAIFGNLAGKWIAAIYAAGWLLCLTIKMFL